VMPIFLSCSRRISPVFTSTGTWDFTR
jgi:hypothetical protein